MLTLYKNYIFDIVVAIIALALSIVMLPVFGISEIFIDIMLALALGVYLVFFLFDKLRHSKGTVFILTIIEFIVIVIVAFGLVFQQFGIIIRFSAVCQTVGLVIWMRGVVMALSLYLASLSAKKPTRSLVKFIIGIVLISLGAALITSTFIPDEVIEWVICVALFVAALVFGALAFLFSPLKHEVGKKSDTKAEETK